MASIAPGAPVADAPLRAAFQKLEVEINRLCSEAHLVAA
jgi:hypothetical protein